MSDRLKDFFVGLGWRVDTASQRKAEQAVKASETTLTATTMAELKRRQDAESRNLTQRVNAIISTHGELDAQEKAHADRLMKVHQDLADKDRKLQEGETKRATERRSAAFKAMQSFALNAAAVAAKAVVALEGTALGITYAVDRTAKKFEGLNYAAQRSATSARGITAFIYAASQLGSSIDEAGGSLERFGDNLKRLPGYAQMLERLGVRTRDAKGNLRDSADIATDFGARLRAMRDRDPKLGYAKALAYGNTLGLDENTTRALMDPKFRQFEAERQAQQGQLGFDPNRASSGALGFEQAMRRLQSVMEDVGDKIRSSLFDKIGPLLEQFATYIRDNGKKISDVLSDLAAAVVNLATAFAKSDMLKAAIEGVANGMQSLAKYVGSDDFKKDIGALADGIGRLAKAVVTALRYFGLLPSSANAAELPSSQQGAGLTSNQQGLLGTMRAAYRGRSFIPDSVRDKANAYLGRLRGGGGPSAISRPQQRENAAAIADELRKAGLPEEAVAMSLGSMQTESSFNTRAHNGVAGGHDGLIQWDRVRWPKIAAWIKEQGGDPYDPRWQARAFVAEGRARPGERLYDGPQTQEGFRMLETSRGNPAQAAAGVRKIERFGFGEEGGRYSNGMAWLKNMPQPPSSRTAPAIAMPKLPDLSPVLKSAPLGPSNSSIMYDNSRAKGDTNITHNPTFNISGGDPLNAMHAARLTASRGQVDLLRNLQGAEQ